VHPDDRTVNKQVLRSSSLRSESHQDDILLYLLAPTVFVTFPAASRNSMRAAPSESTTRRRRGFPFGSERGEHRGPRLVASDEQPLRAQWNAARRAPTSASSALRTAVSAIFMIVFAT
jgi:hypothetical protein